MDLSQINYSILFYVDFYYTAIFYRYVCDLIIIMEKIFIIVLLIETNMMMAASFSIRRVPKCLQVSTANVII